MCLRREMSRGCKEDDEEWPPTHSELETPNLRWKKQTNKQTLLRMNFVSRLGQGITPNGGKTSSAQLSRTKGGLGIKPLPIYLKKKRIEKN
ncbi:hypothetical protein Syun_021209 [Stephania yunnanensis]|uniref:Uncharacterized protein n=1 Tax=Stephania yunnanensis TaxID=152371 RepID=A0AAP0NNY0_9MAGN